ncbi:hypothetical protein B0O99DRAFT_268501 [Bisporella sp. PMI_857]|nr:hypothetical protein B0O99DRAFT_268501 [Bisporella sp. PMI_857]
MVPPQAKCMTEDQRKLVEFALTNAINQGKRFESADAIEEYLKQFLSEELLQSSLRDIFDCHLRLLATLDGQPISPPPTDRSRSITSEASSDGEDRSDVSTLTFASDEPLAISFYRPKFENFGILTAKYCKGRTSYISDEAVSRNQISARNQRIVLTWAHTINPHKRSYTRCEIVSPEQLPNCDLALAEDCGKRDKEEIAEEEEEEGEERRKETISDCLLPSLLLHGISQDDALMLRATSQMNLEAAELYIKKKRMQPISTTAQYPVSLPANRGGNQRKRPRIA